MPTAPYPQPDMWGNPDGAMVTPTPGLGVMFPPQPLEYLPQDGYGTNPNGYAMPGMDGQWGDGNSSQYWNNLVDREFCISG
jgi:hypothetical protein